MFEQPDRSSCYCTEFDGIYDDGQFEEALSNFQQCLAIQKRLCFAAHDLLQGKELF